MKLTARRAVVGFIGAAALMLSMAACADNSSSSGSSSGSGNGGSNTTVSQPSADPSLAAQVPDAIKSKGTITIGVDSTYAPNEYLDTDGTTVIGFDVDLFNAVAAKLGLKTQWQSATFESIIPGVQSGKYDIGVSSFTINKQRLDQATMVSYFNAGTQWAQKTGGNIDPNNACGKKVAVQQGTVQVPDVTEKSKACTDAGKPAITIDQYQKQSDATTAVVTGKDDAMLADSPICAYAVKQTNGQLALAGEIYDAAPYGYVLPKSEKAFGTAIAGAVKSLIDDGEYKTILAKWGVDAGAITDPQVNPTS